MSITLVYAELITLPSTPAILSVTINTLTFDVEHGSHCLLVL